MSDQPTRPERVTASGRPPVDAPDSPAPDMRRLTNGMHSDYWVLSEEERAKGFVRPVRNSYVHQNCGGATRMSQSIAETYAREPTFYGATYCASCGEHFPVGKNGEFVWDGSTEKVGT